MDDTKIAKLQRFINDDVMSNAVYNLVKNTFLSKRGQKDIQILAAERLAVDFLEDAWRELEKYKNPVTEETKVTRQVGL